MGAVIYYFQRISGSDSGQGTAAQQPCERLECRFDGAVVTFNKIVDTVSFAGENPFQVPAVLLKEVFPMPEVYPEQKVKQHCAQQRYDKAPGHGFYSSFLRRALRMPRMSRYLAIVLLATL